MAVYELLPQTNCRECGEPTCFPFALERVAAHAERPAALEALPPAAPAIG